MVVQSENIHIDVSKCMRWNAALKCKMYLCVSSHDIKCMRIPSQLDQFPPGANLSG